MPAKRSNTSPPLIRSPCLAPAHMSDVEKKVKASSEYSTYNVSYIPTIINRGLLAIWMDPKT